MFPADPFPVGSSRTETGKWTAMSHITVAIIVNCASANRRCLWQIVSAAATIRWRAPPWPAGQATADAALAQRVEVADDEVRNMGSESELPRTLVAASSVETAAFGVQSSVLKWRAREDSNS